MTDYLTAADAILLTPFVAGVALIIVFAVAFVARIERADRIARTRDAETARTLDFARDPDAQAAASASYLAHVERMRARQRREQQRVFDDVLGPVDGGAR